VREIDFVLSGLQPYVARGQLKEASAFIDENLGRPEELASVLNVRGLAALDAGDLATARGALAAAVALRPGEAALHVNLAAVCCQLKEFDVAANACRAALAIEPSAPQAQQLLGALMKDLGERPSTLLAFYDFAASPVTFDFVTFLLLAEVERRRRGAAALRVIFVPGIEDGFRRLTERDRAYNRARKEWRVRNIQIPACRLVPECLDPVVCDTRMEGLRYEREAGGAIFPNGYSVLSPKYDYRLKRLLEVAAAGNDVRVLEPTPQAMLHVGEWLERTSKGRGAVSITLRQSDYQPWRNSDAASWAKFARWLEEHDYLPVIVPDTEAHLSGTSLALGAGLEYPAAAVNVELRLALYRECLLNLMVGTGPAAICWGGAGIRYIEFILLQEGATASNAEWFTAEGLPPGTQPGFAGELQRFAWSGQDFETIVGEFESMLERMRKLGVAPN
jgi:hypothetical protein